jgi:hypothetical protein
VPVTGRANYDAVNATLRAMRAAGLLEAVDTGLTALVRSTARALDAAELGTAAFASCARAHAQALDRLEGLRGGDDDAVGRMLDELAAEVGDTEDT